MSTTLRASSAQRYALCPGSWWAEQGLASKDTKESTRGTRIHAILAAMAQFSPLPDANADETDTAQMLWNYLMGWHESQFRTPYTGSGAVAEAHIESGAWSGHPDLYYVVESTLVLVDWKSGWGDVPAAEINAQIRVYAVLLANITSISNIIACIVKPNGITSVKYDFESICSAEKEISAISIAAFEDNARRIPGEAQCRYCPAFGTYRCPDSSQAVIKATSANLTQPMALEQAQAIYSIRGMAAKLIDMAEARIREAIAAGEQCGYALGKTRKTSKIADPVEAYCRLTGPGLLSEGAVMGAATLSLPQLIDAWRKHDRCTEVEARRFVEGILHDVIEVKESKAALVEAK